jgi:hypothetical protein
VPRRCSTTATRRWPPSRGRGAPYRAAALDPRWPSLRNNLAIALRLSGGDRDEEIALLDAAVRPIRTTCRRGSTWSSRGSRRSTSTARSHRGAAREIAPDNALALNNIAMAMKEAQRWDDAERYATRACELAPDDASFRFNLAIIQLVRGNYAAGWRGHEARWDGAGRARRRRRCGPALAGRAARRQDLLVWGEQGSATCCSSRASSPLAERAHREGGRSWNTFPQLGTLMQRSLGAHVDAFSAGGGVDTLPPFDYEVPLIGLPLMLGMETSTLARRCRTCGRRMRATRGARARGRAAAEGRARGRAARGTSATRSGASGSRAMPMRSAASTASRFIRCSRARMPMSPRARPVSRSRTLPPAEEFRRHGGVHRRSIGDHGVHVGCASVGRARRAHLGRARRESALAVAARSHRQPVVSERDALPAADVRRVGAGDGRARDLRARGWAGLSGWQSLGSGSQRLASACTDRCRIRRIAGPRAAARSHVAAVAASPARGGAGRGRT